MTGEQEEMDALRSLPCGRGRFIALSKGAFASSCLRLLVLSFSRLAKVVKNGREGGDDCIRGVQCFATSCDIQVGTPNEVQTSHGVLPRPFPHNDQWPTRLFMITT